MGRYLNHSRYMDYTKDMAEHIYMTEKMKPTDKRKKFLYALRKKCEENGISHKTDRELKTRNNYIKLSRKPTTLVVGMKAYLDSK